MTGWGRVLAGGAILLAAGCSAPAPPPPPPVAAPPPPPASCLLDVGRLGTATGVTWDVESATATESRCVYDPAGTRGTAFVAVTITDGAGELDTIAEVCARGTRQDVASGMVCRTAAGSVIAAAAGDRRAVTITASEIPDGTTVERLTAGLAEQLPP